MFKICPDCGSDEIIVKDTREKEEYIWRRRHCGSCKLTWTTFEITQKEFDRIKNIGKDFAKQIRNYYDALSESEQVKFFDEIIK